jgi:oxygen-independent coproporphyrinogen-3 oxidase
MSLSAYVHLPFCTHKCDFCDFAAFAGLGHLETEYCQIVCREISDRVRKDPPVEALSSIFYGGGTPGLVTLENLTKIHSSLIKNVGIDEICEISLETTPHSISVDKAKGWLALGVNRLSIGVESFQDSELTAIGRDHTRSQALAGLNDALDSGFQNISIDLMYGLPTQTLKSWNDTLDQLFSLATRHQQLKHFSAYSLHLATQSPLYSRFPKNAPEYPEDDEFQDFFEVLVEKASQAGFEHYEVSNFARPGFRSTHNLSYWNNSPYLAFGVSAHRYLNGVRSSNWRSLTAYMKDYLGDETSEEITPEIRMKESIMLGLRLREGINLPEFEKEFGINLLDKFSSQVRKLVEGGLLECSGERMRIANRAVMVSNSVISEFF